LSFLNKDAKNSSSYLLPFHKPSSQIILYILINPTCNPHTPPQPMCLADSVCIGSRDSISSTNTHR
jgi:hypothetical protein